MATYKAISAGNADTLAIWETWNGSAWVAASILPSLDDDVYTNNNIVTITTSQSYNSLNRSSLSSPVIAQGGQFQIDGVNEITLSGQVNGSNVSGAANNPASACVNRLATHINKFHRIGDDVGGSATGCMGFFNNSVYNIDIIGNQLGGSGSSAFGFYNSAASTFNSIVGNQSGGIGGSSHGFYNNAVNTIFSDITGVQSGIPYFGFYNTGDLCEITFISSEVYPQGIYNISATTIINFGGRTFNNLQTGVMAIRSNGNVNFDLSEFRIGLTPTLNEIVLYPANVLENPPVIKDVRDGVIYGIANNYQGTLAVPPAASVALNVSVDDTVGTWAFDDDLILRLKKCSTTEEVDSTVAAYIT